MDCVSGIAEKRGEGKFDCPQVCGGDKNATVHKIGESVCWD
jgi:hypothetical protein